MPDNHIPISPLLLQVTDQDRAVNGSAMARVPPPRALFAAPVQNAHIPAPSLPGDVSMEDWHELLNAVKSRLLLTASEDFAESTGLRLEGSLEKVQTEMVDCVSALNQLHATLTHELERHRNLKRDIDAAQSALARKHNELLGTQAQERRSRHLASHDGLTSLPNRSHFCQCLNQALGQQLEVAERDTLAVLFLDLDLFKQVNDTHGHAVGDEVLKIAATRLRQSIRAEDIVSRLGGDEFACLLRGFPDRQTLGLHAAKILTTFASAMSIGTLNLMIRPSIGIAVFPGDGVIGPELLQHADAAMYVAKKKSSGYAFYDEVQER